MASRTRCTTGLLAGLLLAVPVQAQPPTMSSYWPNDDGRSWKYDQHYEDFDGTPEVVDNQARIFFAGTTVAPDGIQAQYLREEVLGSAPQGLALAATVRDPLLRTLWVARPDLHARILQAAADYPCPEEGPPGARTLLLGGNLAYQKTADEIVAWRCNAPNTKAWLWLVSDVSIGNSFTFQLIPDIADNIFLHGTIAAVEDVVVPAGTYHGCLRVDYLIDYGRSYCTDEGGVRTGSFRSETRGYVHYAPGVGPVESFEEFIPVLEVTGDCAPLGQVGQVLARASLRLNSDPVPARPLTWGRIKSRYR